MIFPINKRFIPSVVWILIITILSLVPSSGIETIWFDFPIPLDKIVHFGLYAVCSFLLFYGKRWTSASLVKNGKTLLFVVLSVILYSVLLELLQSTNLINRNASFLDIIANILGVSAGILLYVSLAKKINFLR
ncbi:MAG: VanZ family protein [Bacteroidetes bacterium]|nr:VanZ family protein [Bacteroidota bacterium]MBT3421514.1 VanZ family protein [Bacteroidota bacterium]MBT3800728.1 VanZ family protein [Bacteroidota bacterium]MBT3934872.1 VanZ family protein [Bacteroidota bacterium]MBT4340038.1 VanZ family protein [Bacteroidota bacterium]